MFIDLLTIPSISDGKVTIALTVSPVGEPIIPQTSHQLKLAITNILESLEDLHKYEHLGMEGGREKKKKNIILFRAVELDVLEFFNSC